MIDTNKYEGHTPAPWTLSEEYAYELFVYAGDVRLAKIDGNMMNEANAQLMADAPLLLAEVKRLRDELKFVVEMLEGKPSNMEWYECRNLILEQVVIDLDD